MRSTPRSIAERLLALALVLAIADSAFAAKLWIKKANNSSWSGKTNIACDKDSTYLYCIDRTTNSATNAASRWASDGTLVQFNGCSMASVDNPVYRLWGVIGSTLYCGAASAFSGNATIRVQSCSLPACSSWSDVYNPTSGSTGRFGPYGVMTQLSSISHLWAATVANSGGHRAYDGTTVKVSESNGMIPDVSESLVVGTTFIALGARRDNLDGYTEHGMNSSGSSLYSQHIQTHATTTGVGVNSTSHLVASSTTHTVFCMRGTSNTYCATVKVSDGTEAAWNVIAGDVRTGVSTSVLTGSTAVALMKSDGTCLVGNAVPPTGFTPNATCALTLDASDNARILADGPDWDGDSSADPVVLTGVGGDMWVWSTAAPVVTLSALPATQDVGGNVTVTWSVTDATSCTASGTWSGAKNATSGSQLATVQAEGTNTYTLSCTGPGGSGNASANVTGVSVGGLFTVPPYGNRLTGGTTYR